MCTVTYKITWSTTDQPEWKATDDTQRVHTAVNWCGVVVNVYAHVSVVTVRSTITKRNL